MGVLRSVIGAFSWTPPNWLTRVGPKRVALAATLIVAVVAGAVAAWRYVDNLPKPPHVVATANAPGITPVVDGKLIPEHLTIDFAIRTDPRIPTLSVDSVARLDLIGTELKSGVTMEPATAGIWHWQSETRLAFKPDADWPAGQRYRVYFDASLFTPELEFERHDVEFETADFAATLDELLFYQDPVHRSDRKIVATLSFTHPVDAQSLDDKLSFTMRESGKPKTSTPQAVERDIRFDAIRRTAYVHSETIEIPTQENYLTLTLREGLAPASGQSQLENELSDEVLIPDIDSYFRTSAVRSTITRNADDEPQQTLILEFTDHVRVDALADKLKAWVLPTDGTLNGQRFTDKRWQSPREITSEILSQSKPVGLELNPTEHDAAQFHSSTIDVPENAQIYVAIAAGLESDGGFNMSVPYDEVVSAEAYPKEVKIARSGSIVPLSGDHKLTLLSRGVKSLKVEVARVIDSEVNHLASQTGGDIQSPWFQNYQFDQDNLTVRATRFIDLQPDHPKSAVYSSLDLSEFLSDGGYFFVNVQGWNRKTNQAVGGNDRRLVLLTDLGLLVKTNADDSHDIFVHSISSGQAVAGAEVALLGKNGVPIFERRTPSDGHVSLPSSTDFDREKTPTVFIVRRDGDSIFMPYNRGDRRLQYSRFDVGGEQVRRSVNANRLKAQLFSDRGIYRPGDAVNIAAIVKNDEWQALERLPLVLRVTDARRQTVLEQNLRLPEEGFFEQQLDTSASSATGEYVATLYLIDDNKRRRSIGSTSFKVEEFLPDRLKIQSSISGQKPRGWLKPLDLFAEVKLENLFGTPAQSRRVRGNLELRPSNIHFATFPDYTFADPMRIAGNVLQTVVLQLDDVETDSNGVAKLPLNVQQYDKGIYQLSVSTEGFEEGGGRSVSSRASVMMSPLDALLGYKSDTDLSWLDRSSSQHVELISLNSDADPVDLDGLTLTHVEERYVSTLVRRANGTYAYQSVLKTSNLSEEDFAVAASGTRLPLPTEKAGTFALVITDSSGLMYGQIRYTVAGARNMAGNLERNAELSLALNGSGFSPGDAIEMEITAPYTGTGLITIERDRVYSHKWFHTDTTTSVQSITIPNELEGNAYVNVAFVRDLNSPEVFVSPLSYAVQPFTINRSARTIDINLEAPEFVRPGDTLAIKHEASQQSKIVVYAVDEGILQVAQYSAPQPLDYFLPKMALQVGTFQMVDLILPEFAAFLRSAAPGGGEAAGLAGQNLNPFRRKTEPPVVFWSGIVDSGPESQSIAFDVPDYFNGRLRIMAVAVNNDAVGRSVRQTTVRGPFVVTPNLLTAAAPGDEFEVTVGVANNLRGSGADAEISLTATASEHLQILTEANTSLNISEGSEGRASFRVRALENFGAAALTFEARSRSEHAQRSATVSIRPSVAYVSTVVAGSSSEDPVELPFGRELHPHFARQSAAASTSPLVLADGMLEYLDVFPHACAEQIVSKVFPQIGFLSTDDQNIDRAAIRRSFANTVNKLRARQASNGGFRFWPSSRETADFPSVYLTHFLTDAREFNLPVPPAMLNSALDYLRQIAGRDANTITEARLRAYAIYVLTRNSYVTTNYLSNLHEHLDRDHKADWRNDLTASYMAASYELLKQSVLGAGLLGDYELGSGDEMSGDFDTRLGRDAQHVYLIAKHFPEQLRSIDPGAIQKIVDPIMRNRFNTLSASYATLALSAYTDTLGVAATAGLRISGNNGDASEILARADGTVRVALQQSFDSIRAHSAGTLPLFYVATQSGFDRVPPASSLANGLELHRDFLDNADQPVERAEIGDELTVRLRIRSTGRPRSNVAVVDLLPGGFEVLRDSIRNDFRGWYADYMDVREDRVVIYGSFSDRVTEIRYRVKVTSAGSFVVPSAFAGSMYDRDIEARTAPGRFDVHPSK